MEQIIRLANLIYGLKQSRFYGLKQSRFSCILHIFSENLAPDGLTIPHKFWNSLIKQSNIL